MAETSSQAWTVGSYTIQPRHVIGRGAYGIVYIAKDDSNNMVAAKCIDTCTHRRLQLENLDRLLKLQHVNIMSIMQIEKEQDSLWMFMEYCRDGDLNKFFRTRDVSTIKSIEMMIQIMRGVDYLHRNRIIHRDIKPANILVACDNPFCVKLTDFDVSKFLNPAIETSVMTSNVGTNAFKAPEFFGGRISYHSNVDIFACGLTFLAMMQGNEEMHLIPKLETAENPTEKFWIPIGQTIVTRQRYNEQNLDVVRIQLPGSNPAPVTILTCTLKKLIQKMTCAVPRDRLSAVEVLEALEEIEHNAKNNQWEAMTAACASDPNVVHCVELEKTHGYGTRVKLAHLIQTNEQGELLTRGKIDGYNVFQVMNRTSGTLKIEVRSHCNHDFLGYCVSPTEAGWVIEVCQICKEVRRYNMHAGEDAAPRISSALGGTRAICPGPEGSLLIMDEDGRILQVQWHHEEPKIIHEIETNIKNVVSIHYMEQHNTVVITSPTADVDSTGNIQAVKLEDGSTRWKFIPEDNVDPGGICMADNDRLLVADTGNRSVLLLVGSTGKLLQIFRLERSYIQDVCWSSAPPQLTVAHGSVYFNMNISCYNMIEQ